MKHLAVKSRNRTLARPRRPGLAYLALIDAFPLRPIRSDQDHDAATTILGKLAAQPEGGLDPEEQDYFEALTMLVEAYDQDHYAELEPGDPVDMLKYVMQESGMTQADLGRLLGNRALASLILNGHRQLSKNHIGKLAKHFKVSPALFFAVKDEPEARRAHLRQRGQ